MHDGEVEHLVHEWVTQSHQLEPRTSSSPVGAEVTLRRRVFILMDAALSLFTRVASSTSEITLERRFDGPGSDVSHYVWWKASPPRRYFALQGDHRLGQRWWRSGVDEWPAAPWQPVELDAIAPGQEAAWILRHLAQLADPSSWSREASTVRAVERFAA